MPSPNKTIPSRPSPPHPSSLEVAIREMRKVRDKREPGKERDAMDKMIQIAVDHLEMDAIIELDIYAEGFADGKRINNQ